MIIKQYNTSKHNKIPSFTILELMISLLISSIVITIVYYTLMLFNNQWMNYQSKSKQRNEYLLLKNAIGIDVDRASAITDSSDEKILTIFVDFTQKIQYQLGSSHIIRVTGNQVDTFYCGGSIAGIRHEDDSTRLVTSFFLNVSVNKDIIPFLLNKEYTAKELMRAPVSEK